MGWERKEAQQTVEALFKYLTETLQEESQQLKNFIQLDKEKVFLSTAWWRPQEVIASWQYLVIYRDELE